MTNANENPRGLPVVEIPDVFSAGEITLIGSGRWVGETAHKVIVLKLATDYAAIVAERDALRDMNRRQARRVMEQESERIAAEARANRLADAGRRVTAAFRAHGEATPYTRNEDRTRHECEAAMLALDAALEQEGKRDE